MTLKTSFRQTLLTRFVRDVPIAQLRHSTKDVYLEEGYGGRPIEFFPPYRFFRLYEEDRKDEAREQFRAWYRQRFKLYSAVGKRAGGMHEGSLYRLVVAEHEKQGIPFSSREPRFVEGIVDRIIGHRVDQRFELLTAIRDRGYEVIPSDRVIGVRGPEGTIYLNGGHHRAAALKAIGESVLPGVMVLSPRARAMFYKIRLVK